ncbi:MAG: ABC transporter permease [Candidatus Zixiibacteriota bacterium]|nr:MAG: ABC transporter permease [candidate division Zixibacteria bacterium]
MTLAEVKDGILLAFDSLSANKFRSGLTILGVLIGVWSVIAMSSLIKGLDDAVQNSINEIGSNILFVDRFPPDKDYDDLTEEERNYKHMTVMEAVAIQENCPAVAAVSPENHYWAPGGNVVKYKGNKANRPAVVGLLPAYLKVRDAAVTSGRFISRIDNDTRAKVCVIGTDVKDALFPEEDPIDKQIRVNNVRFTVIGVREKSEAMFGDHMKNNKVAIPLETFEKLYPWDIYLTLSVSVKSIDQIEEAREQITAILRKVRRVPYNKENDFAIFGQESLREMVGNITKYIYIAMIVISSIGLMVGGVGVMNIMLVSVTERTREIGVRKAIGARRNNILWQFLVEAMTLSGTGGSLGIAAGILTALFIGAVSPLPFGISPVFLTLGFMVAISVGLVAGMYPAYRAARVDPIESLRYE